MKKKRMIYRTGALLLSWRQSFSVYVYMLKLLISLSWNLVKTPKQKDFWIRDFFQRTIRDPEIFLPNLKYNLRVCVTYRCNLVCRYCYTKGLEANISKDMSVEDFSRLVIWAKNNGWRSITFLGGEPTIHPEFIEMLGACYRNRMFVTIFTNNLFSAGIIPKIDTFWLQNIHIHYIPSLLNTEQKELFKENLKQLKARGIPFHFSYIIDHHDEDWTGILNDLNVYRPMYIKASLVLPGFSKQTTASEVCGNIKCLADKMFKIQEICIKLGIPFFVYRPIPLCMFSQKEWQILRKVFSFTAFSRCPIGFRGDYGIMVVVNPDLSTLPCPSVFIKGPNIFTFKDKKQISQFYKDNLKQLLSKPLMESCIECNAHRKFITTLEGGMKSNFDEGMCQGGCLNFKTEAQILCHAE